MKRLTDEQIQGNKDLFIKILTDSLISRGCEESKIDSLITKLEKSDFFVAPASTKYHSSFKGGLVYHCLNVYKHMMDICTQNHMLCVHEVVNEYNDSNEIIASHDNIVEGEIERDSIVIVALLHDLSKMNYYTTSYRNKKVYSENGSKRDELGNFDWVSVAEYTTIPVEDRFLFGSHEETAEYMIRQFIGLTWEESSAIINHHMTLGFDSSKDVGTVSNIYNRNTLAAVLHMADMMSVYIDERY